ncbi:ty3-gypsy retrotransposon protein [Cucumis melo var. makuwa]|uniref:Ty3-gypsy retrotransposon protein n=1 Tax=Cucumis melo var. makuwa TaxID=1194695 RepID=A0A5D3BVS1_CUCMM|nr:ty3-gypsy retrotransposon protein [Cucumis melo var. makuwa]
MHREEKGIEGRRSLPPSSSPPPPTFLSPHPVYPTQPRTTEVSCSLPSSTYLIQPLSSEQRQPAIRAYWRGDVRVQEFYDKRSRSQLSSTWVDSFGRGLERDFNYISGKGFLTTGPRTEAGNIVVHMGLYVNKHRCPDVLCIVVMLVGYVVNWNSMSMDYKVLRLCKWKSVVGTLVMELCCGRIKSPRTSRIP